MKDINNLNPLDTEGHWKNIVLELSVDNEATSIDCYILPKVCKY